MLTGLQGQAASPSVDPEMSRLQGMQVAAHLKGGCIYWRVD